MPGSALPATLPLEQISGRIQTVLAGFAKSPDPRMQTQAEELVRLLAELYGTGLARIVELLDGAAAGRELLTRLIDDKFVAGLLILHDLHPADLAQRVQAALDSVRPYLGSHAGGVELLDIEGGVVRLSLQGSCDGCPSSTLTVKHAIERAITEAAPEISSVQVEGVVAQTGGGPSNGLLQIQPLQRGSEPPPPAPDGPVEWVTADDVADLAADQLAHRFLAGTRVLVCGLGDSINAYRSRCPACASRLDGAKLLGEALTCGACGQPFDVRRAGRGIRNTGLNLQPFPLLEQDGEVRIAVPVGTRASATVDNNPLRPPPPLASGLANMFGQARVDEAGVERCDMCSVTIGAQHSHVVSIEDRSLQCTCRPCYLLFTQEGAAQGRYHAVPQRYRYDPRFAMTPAQWDRVQIPVRIAFFFHNSDIDQPVAFYPSPAGATESLLDLAAWDEVLRANPQMADLQPDVEALLVYRNRNRDPEDHGFECFSVPIDACYELVGLVRMTWKGFDGGTEAWDRIEQFFATLRERSRLIAGATASVPQ